MVESAQAQVEDKERSELEMKVEMELMREELERLRCSEDTLQNRLVCQSFLAALNHTPNSLHKMWK